MKDFEFTSTSYTSKTKEESDSFALNTFQEKLDQGLAIRYTYFNIKEKICKSTKFCTITL